MERRELLGVLGVGAAGLWTTGAVASQQEGKKREEEHGKEGEKQHRKEVANRPGHEREGGEHGADHEHMKIVGECAAICNATTRHCIEKLAEEGGKNRKVHAKAAVLTNDCQDFCVLHIKLMIRHSPLAHLATQACADACRDCAKACDEGDDEMMKKCAEICRECEKACREHLEKCEKKS